MSRATRPLLSVLLVLALVAAAVFGLYRETRPVLHLYVWDGYFPADVLARFELEFGVRIETTTYRNNDEMLARLKVSWSEFDVVMPSNYMIEEMRRRQLLLRLTEREVPNIHNVRREFFDAAHGWTESSAYYGVPYMLNFAGIAYAERRVNPPPATWKEFFSEATARAYGANLALLDEQRETMGLALIALGYSPNSQNPAELEQVRQLLRAQKQAAGDGPRFVLAEGRELLTKGDIALLATWAPEITLAQRDGAAVGHVLPAEGSILTFDTLAIPVSSARQKLAMQFVNFALRPEIARRMTDYSCYANSIREDLDRVSPEMQQTPSYVRPPLENTFLLGDLGEAQHLYDAIWSEYRGRRN